MRFVTFSLLLISLVACSTPPVPWDAPDGFLSLKPSPGQPDQVKATSSGDARIWVRRFEDRDGGSLQFWVEALRNDLVRNRGYKPTGESDTLDAKGEQGKILRFEVDTAGELHGYAVALFVREGEDPHQIRILEYIAPIEEYETHLQAVLRSISTLVD